MEKTYLAIDLGAESGRAILGRLLDGKLSTEEVHRFPNKTETSGGRLRWDLPALMEQVHRGIAKAAAKNGGRLDGIAVDDQSGGSVSNAGDVNGDGFLSPIDALQVINALNNLAAAQPVAAVAAQSTQDDVQIVGAALDIEPRFPVVLEQREAAIEQAFDEQSSFPLQWDASEGDVGRGVHRRWALCLLWGEMQTIQFRRCGSRPRLND